MMPGVLAEKFVDFGNAAVKRLSDRAVEVSQYCVIEHLVLVGH